jgi:hypothetical protein
VYFGGEVDDIRLKIEEVVSLLSFSQSQVCSLGRAEYRFFYARIEVFSFDVTSIIEL